MNELPESPYRFVNCNRLNNRGIERWRSRIRYLNPATNRFQEIYVAMRETEEEARAVAEEFLRTGVRPPKIKQGLRLVAATKARSAKLRAERAAKGEPIRKYTYVKVADFIGPRLPRKTVDTLGRRLDGSAKGRPKKKPRIKSSQTDTRLIDRKRNLRDADFRAPERKPADPARVEMMKMVLARLK